MYLKADALTFGGVMSRRLSYQLLCAAILLFLLSGWLFLKTPVSGIESKGEDSKEIIALITLITAIASLLTSLVGLSKSVIDARQHKK